MHEAVGEVQNGFHYGGGSTFCGSDSLQSINEKQCEAVSHVFQNDFNSTEKLLYRRIRSPELFLKEPKPYQTALSPLATQNYQTCCSSKVRVAEIGCSARLLNALLIFLSHVKYSSKTASSRLPERLSG